MVVLSACCTVFLPSRAKCALNGPSRAHQLMFRSFLRQMRWSCCAQLSRKEGELQDARGVVRSAAVLASSMGIDEEAEKKNGGVGLTFLNANSEEELLSCIQREAQEGKITPKIAFGMNELYYSYKKAVLQSRSPLAEEMVLSNMRVVLDRIMLDVKDPFTFPPYHKAVREPFDYFTFGQNYFRPLVDLRNSYIGNVHIFNEIEDKVKKGDNIVLISNHQTEADPYIIALLLERTNPQIAEEMIYIAGDRVVSDPLCKPFSMGRNLLCVHSKKHLYDFPELTEMKKRANTRSLKELALLLKSGGQVVWIAPSGGRDRPDPISGEWYPAPFDVSSVDNIRRLAIYSGIPSNIYPLSILCYDIMPPPPQVEKQIGEPRDISFHGVGLSLGSEVNFNMNEIPSQNLEKAKMDFTQALYDSVTEQYNVLKAAIYERKGFSASTSVVSLSQPWK